RRSGGGEGVAVVTPAESTFGLSRVHNRVHSRPKVDVPPDINIDVVDEDDDINDDEDTLPHDLAESDNEDLINVYDDGVDKMLPGPTAVTVEVRIAPLHIMYAIAWVALLTEPCADQRVWKPSV
nr:hypothetical protein [Tanacetum cinerariifolium]